MRCREKIPETSHTFKIAGLTFKIDLLMIHAFVFLLEAISVISALELKLKKHRCPATELSHSRIAQTARTNNILKTSSYTVSK